MNRSSNHKSMNQAKAVVLRIVIYGILLAWTFICLFPIYWTVTTSVKTANAVTQGLLVPFWDFVPSWNGWRALGLSPENIFAPSAMRETVLLRLTNSVIMSTVAPALAIVLGAPAAYGLTRFEYRWGRFRNNDISFFFVSQLILPPVVLAMPLLVLYQSLNLLDSRLGLILLYTLMVLPIVIWIARDQFASLPNELEQAAMVDGCTSWGAFIRIILPLTTPGLAAAFILSVIMCWNEYFFSALLTRTNAQTLPALVAAQTSSQGIQWWSMAAISTLSVAPLIFVGIFLERYIVRGLTSGALKG